MSEYMNLDPNLELDWDGEVSNDGSFVLLPEGDYPYTITKFERARYGGSSKVPPCKMAQLTVAVHGAQGDASVSCRLFLLAKFQWKIAELFVSLGLASPDDEKVRMQWDRVQGGTGLCHVAQREFTKQSGPHAGETGTANEITKFLPPPAPKAAEPAQPAWQQSGMF